MSGFPRPPLRPTVLRPALLRPSVLAAALVLAIVTPAGASPSSGGGGSHPAAPQTGHALAGQTLAGQTLAGQTLAGHPLGAHPLRNLPTSLLVTLRSGLGPEAVDARAAALGLERVAWNPDLRTAQYVALSGAGGGAGLAVAAATARAGRFDGRERLRLAGLATELRHVVGVAAAAAPVRLGLAADPVAAPVTPSVVAPPPPVAAPNDTLWSTQWAPDAVGARSAWALTRGRPEIVVAVLDTGVDLGHPDLAGRLVPGTDIGAGDADPTDEDGHGTHVAGIIAAIAGNARGVAGIAPAVLVMPVKVMDGNGQIWDTSVAEGIAWAVARGARVINLSLGGNDVSAAIDAAIDAARARGVVVVAAAGNNGAGVSQPGAYGPSLAVAALEDRPASVDANGDGVADGCGVVRYAPGDYRHASYSNVGPEVDLAAPGSCIVSTYSRRLGSSYAVLSGTSMATPMVSAAAALVISRNPSLGAAAVEAALTGTATDLGTPGRDLETGAGLLRAGAAVASVAAPAADGVAPAVRWSGIADGRLVRGRLSLAAAVVDASPVVATRIERDGATQLVRRTAGVTFGWSSATVADGIHRWTAHGLDAGLLEGSSSVRVLVANHHATSTIRASLRMTATARRITRTITLARRTPLVARFTGPPGAWLVLKVVNASGKVVAKAGGTGSAVIALSSLRAGRYRLRAVTSVARPGLSLRLTVAWYR